MGDLYWGSVYQLPYWEFIDAFELDEEQRRFLTHGCLVMLITMAFETLDGAGDYILDKLDSCRDAAARVKSNDEETRFLVETLQMALSAITNEASRQELEEELERRSRLIHTNHVRAYFLSQAAQ
ncbi:hypothetical protein RAS2_12070 [Phycisphaerae bacterium RAS2]|nr:hypothetical protein RAS2_12070 [Phycisphaerae bacterium RAS2]